MGLHKKAFGIVAYSGSMRHDEAIDRSLLKSSKTNDKQQQQQHPNQFNVDQIYG